MNAAIITEDVRAAFQKRYGKSKQISKGQIFTFGTAITCSINYSKFLRGGKYFYAVPTALANPASKLPQTELGEYAVFICGSADRIIVVPGSIIVEMLTDVPTRRLDIFEEGDAFILQTTKHPKLDVTAYLNAFPPTKRPSGDNSEDIDRAPQTDRLHVKMQFELIQLGKAEGCSVWVPVLDRNLSFNGIPFSSETLERLPNFGFVETTRRIVQNIDVLWLKKNVIQKAFEIEATTAIYSGLLRLNDLALSQPNNQIQLYVATTKARKPRVLDQLIRPSFHHLLDSCRFVSFEHIDEQFNRLKSLGAGKGIRVSGLVEGEQFQTQQNLVYPGFRE